MAIHRTWQLFDFPSDTMAATPEHPKGSESMPALEPPTGFPLPGFHKTKSNACFHRGIARPQSFGFPMSAKKGCAPLTPMKFKRQSLTGMKPIKKEEAQAALMAEKVDQLRGLHACCIVKTGHLFQADGYSAAPLQDSRELAMKLQDMTKLLETPNIFEFLTDEINQGILHVLELNILKPCADVPQQFVLCDQMAKLTTFNRSVYLALYNILALMIRKCEVKRFVEWLTPSILNSIVRCLDTPDEDEQAAVEGVVSLLCTSYQDRREDVYEYVMKRLQMCAYGVVPHYFVAPGLRFISANQKALMIVPKNPDEYVANILPLFRSSFLPVFARDLEEVSKLFYSNFDTLPYHVLGYLFEHWPVTDSSKVPCYLRHLGVLVPLLGTETIQAVTSDIFHELAFCVASPNYKVAMAALNLLSDRSFMSHFAEMSDELLPIVCAPIAEKGQYWHLDVARQAAITLQVIKDINQECCATLEQEYSQHVAVDGESKFPEETWMVVFEQAAASNLDFDVQAFKKQIESLRGK